MINFEFCAMTDPGKKRGNNQDTMLLRPDLGLFVIADGMGGHQGGKMASTLACSAMESYFTNALHQKIPIIDPKNFLALSIKDANHTIYAASDTTSPGYKGMGTTITSLFFYEKLVIIGQVGDSRCYLSHGNHLWQLTKDHSMVEEGIRAGTILPSSALIQNFKNILTRSVGFEKDVQVDLYYRTVLPGDIFLLCSDGLSNMIDDEQIKLSIESSALKDTPPFSELAEYFINKANEHGGDDNISCIIIKTL